MALIFAPEPPFSAVKLVEVCPEILRLVAERVKAVVNVNVLKVYLDHTSSLNVSLILLAVLFLFLPSLFLLLFPWVLSLTESITQSELA